MINLIIYGELLSLILCTFFVDNSLAILFLSITNLTILAVFLMIKKFGRLRNE